MHIVCFASEGYGRFIDIAELALHVWTGAREAGAEEESMMGALLRSKRHQRCAMATNVEDTTHTNPCALSCMTSSITIQLHLI